jgi:thymidylate synthase ThyX
VEKLKEGKLPRMKPKQITVKLVRYTVPFEGSDKGLITFEIEVPLFVWTELLTHRRLSRNASSARAMGTKRYAEMGYYLPETWYEQGTGMQAGSVIEDLDIIDICKEIYADAFIEIENEAQLLSHLGIAKEQANRIIPPIKMVRGIVTGTYAGWQAFLKLRNHPSADTAMQLFALQVKGAIEHTNPVVSLEHMPYIDETGNIVSAIARIARVSYARSSGKDDQALYTSLKDSGHWSCFEHIAYWKKNPLLSNFSCIDNDVLFLDNNVPFPKNDYLGWEQLRQII